MIATGAADRILQRGDGDLKLARTIWVVFSWFAATVIAAVAAGIVCLTVNYLGIVGMVAGLVVNVVIRTVLRKRGDAQEKRVHEQALDRLYPERFTEYEG